jgi:outer membrane protein assembly factor BamB
MPARKEMHMKTRSLILAAVGVYLITLTAGADDWPGWRGPQRTGISKETGLLKAWPKDGPKLLWQVTDVGDGYATPAVVGDRLYVLSNKGTDDEFLQARSVKDGTQLWSIRLGKVGPNQMANYPAARSTPSVDGDLIYALGSDGDLVCAKTADGAIVWRKSLRTDFGGAPGLWAYSESPLVDGDLLVCTPGGADATLVALDRKKGALVWKSAVPGGDQAAYASIISVEVGGLKQYVQFLQNGLVGIDAKTGKFLWRYNKTAANSLANIPTPITHDGYVFSTTGKGGAGLVKLKVDNGKVSADEIYFKKGLPSSIGGAVLRGNSLFGTNTDGMLCIDFATGMELWQNASVGPASVCYADGRLYVHGENGNLALVEPTPEAYREHGRFTPPGQPKRGKSKAWAYPVVANGRLYIRDLGVIWCYDVAVSKAK